VPDWGIRRLGPYRLLHELGGGGMGVVYLAEDVPLERMVALKVMRPALLTSATARHRFLREARSAAAIEHDHIVPIYHVGEDRGIPYLAMPLLRGTSLENRLRFQPRLPWPEALQIAREIATGLAAAHARGLVHRDIKPANIWLEAKDEDGRMKDARAGSAFRVKILDFGIAQVLEQEDGAEGADSRPLAHPSAVVGTPAYTAPEQVGHQHVDHRADLFSLGCVLYRMATGVEPFHGQDVTAMLIAVCCDPPVPPRKLCRDLPRTGEELLLRLLAKDPGARPQSAQEVVAALAALETECRRPRRSRWRLVLDVAALLALLGVGGVVAASLYRYQGWLNEVGITSDGPAQRDDGPPAPRPGKQP
jgi:serine/threonine protein kinase